MNIIRVPFCILAAALSVSGCAPRIGLNPLEGWKELGSTAWQGLTAPGERSPALSKSITDDYRDFIAKLPIRKGRFVDRSESYFIDQLSFYQDETGQHAVRVRIPMDGTYWNYALFYNRSDVRTKVIKYASGRYRS